MKTKFIKLIYVTIAISVLTFLSYIGYLRAKQAHDFAAIITRVDIITMALRGYVEDHGEFPTDLNILRKEAKLDPRLVQPLHNEVITYTAPARSDPPNTIVLRISLPQKSIVVNKAFHRNVSPAQ